MKKNALIQILMLILKPDVRSQYISKEAIISSCLNTVWLQNGVFFSQEG